MPTSVPAKLEVPTGNEAFRVGHAFGTQNYVCLPVDSIGHVAWTLFTPEATLLGEQDEQLTTHFFSPNPVEGGVVRATWEDSVDTSFVWARALESATVDANAITWVLLQTAGTEVGPTGGDTLAKTTFVQRVNTREALHLRPAVVCQRTSAARGSCRTRLTISSTSRTRKMPRFAGSKATTARLLQHPTPTRSA